jgi:hypothetical protein
MNQKGLSMTEATEDTTELTLRSWGLSGQPVAWAWTSWQPVVLAIRAVNTGFGDQAMVQTALDTVFPGLGYQAANVCLAHPVSAEFTVGESVLDPGAVAVVHVELVDDADLGLPDEQVTWDFGDGTAPVVGAGGADHGYSERGDYTISCTIPVAGVLYSTTQGYATDRFASLGPYDPNEHTVVEVLEYLREHPDEAKAVLAAEDAGKGRVTILDKGI